jgi:hypothetical protein
MSARTLKLLLGALIGLFVVWLLVTLLPGSPGGRGTAPEALASYFEGVGPERVSVVRFRNPEGARTVELESSSGSWRVNGYRADSAMVARFWATLGEAGMGDLVASNPLNHPRMGVAVDSAWTLELELPSGSRSLLVGEATSRYGSVYVRLPEQDDVYLLEANLRPHVTRSLDDWRSKRIAGLDTARIGRIEADGEGGAFTLQRGDSLWTTGDGSPADSAAAQRILAELSGLDASGFVTASDTLSASGGWLTALGMAGDTLIHVELGSGDGERWLRVRGDSITYRISSWRAGRLLPKRQDLTGG